MDLVIPLACRQVCKKWKYVFEMLLDLTPIPECWDCGTFGLKQCPFHSNKFITGGYTKYLGQASFPVTPRLIKIKMLHLGIFNPMKASLSCFVHSRECYTCHKNMTKIGTWMTDYRGIATCNLCAMNIDDVYNVISKRNKNVFKRKPSDSFVTLTNYTIYFNRVTNLSSDSIEFIVCFSENYGDTAEIKMLWNFMRDEAFLFSPFAINMIDELFKFLMLTNNRIMINIC